MKTYLTFNWKISAPTYLTCRTRDIPAFNALGWVQEISGSQHLAKITHPDRDLAELVWLVRSGASFLGNIESTTDSGPALIAAHSQELVIVACTDAAEPMITLLKSGVMWGTAATVAYWRVLSAAKSVLNLETPRVRDRLRIERNQFDLYTHFTDKR